MAGDSGREGISEDEGKRIGEQAKGEKPIAREGTIQCYESLHQLLQANLKPEIFQYIKAGPVVGFVYWAPEYHFLVFFNRLRLQD